jgi:hypothetical protein
MFSIALFALLLTAVHALAPSSSTRSGVNLNMDFRGAVGAQAPLGFWDPLGFLKDADQERFDRLRSVRVYRIDVNSVVFSDQLGCVAFQVELKHGRISMLAILGHLVTTAGNRLPGNIAYGVPFSSVKSGLAAFDTIPAAGTMQLVRACLLLCPEPASLSVIQKRSTPCKSSTRCSL